MMTDFMLLAMLLSKLFPFFDIFYGEFILLNDDILTYLLLILGPFF